jgi:hypothetical protein
LEQSYLQPINIIISECRECIVCRTSKSISEFYKQSGNSEAQVRWDKKCKACKRKSVNAGRIPQKSKHLKIAKRSAAPVNVSKGDISGTTKPVEDLDFADLEQSCDKKLSLAEKHDAVQRFNELISLFREGYAELVGCERVYVRKD